MHAAQNLKKRAFWLNAEEACEFEVSITRLRQISCWSHAANCLHSEAWFQF